MTRTFFLAQHPARLEIDWKWGHTEYIPLTFLEPDQPEIKETFQHLPWHKKLVRYVTHSTIEVNGKDVTLAITYVEQEQNDPATADNSDWGRTVIKFNLEKGTGTARWFDENDPSEYVPQRVRIVRANDEPLNPVLSQRRKKMRGRLIKAAQQGDPIEYGELMKYCKINRFELQKGLGLVGHECVQLQEPQLTALAINKATRHCSQGLENEFDITDEEAERQRCYEHWGQGGSWEDATKGASPDAATRELIFTRAAIRPGQAKFRLAVYRACGGRCVISGCDVPEALEAAHLKGRIWKDGHNSSSDGILLRRDLHALYDKGCITISLSKDVSLLPKIRDNETYKGFEGKRLALPFGEKT
jgi:hypothetical protein